MIRRLSDRYQSVTELGGGWSADRKFKVVTKDGDTRLLRVSTTERLERKKLEYDVMTRFLDSGITMNVPLSLWTDPEEDSVFMELTWIEGQDLSTVLPTLTEDRQYALGREAGTILRALHNIQVPEGFPDRGSLSAKKLRQLDLYERSVLRIDDDHDAIRFVKDNIHLTEARKKVLCHGDFHPNNLILMDDGHLGVIDFDRLDLTDPYEAFYKIQSFGRTVSVPYCVGQIDAYFDDDVPDDFFPAHAVYVAQASLYSIIWASKFTDEDISVMVSIARQAFLDHDGFGQTVPHWYGAWKKKAGLT
jgi:aminoglycoside phosphotransferase (APT) family kinase protein